MKRTVIIPALNPDPVLLQIAREVWKHKNFVIVVDDGSDPSCQELFETISETCVVLHHPENRGKGEAIRTVFRTVTGADVSDTQTGLRAFSSDLLDMMYQVSGSRYEYETNVLLACVRRNIPILEIPIATIYHDRSNSCSHFRKIRDSARIYGGLFKFALSSLSSFFLDYGLFAGFTLLLPHETLSILGANVAARLISAFYNYEVNCRFVFREKQEFRTATDYAALALLILIIFLRRGFCMLFLDALLAASLLASVWGFFYLRPQSGISAPVLSETISSPSFFRTPSLSPVSMDSSASRLPRRILTSWDAWLPL